MASVKLSTILLSTNRGQPILRTADQDRSSEDASETSHVNDCTNRFAKSLGPQAQNSQWSAQGDCEAHVSNPGGLPAR